MTNAFSRVIVLPFSAIILLLTPLSAMALDRLDRFDLDLNVGSRVDQFDWNISGNIAGNTPSIISELTWEDLEIAEINSRARIILFNNHFPFGGAFKVSVNYGEILAGDNQDSDYQYDARTGEWSRSNNKSDDGNVWDLSTAVGPAFRTRDRKFTVSPLIGFSYHAQNLTLNEGYQTISQDNPFSPDPADNPPPVGPISGLNSTYEAEWRSGWVGVDLEFQPTPKFELHGSVEVHSAEYKAEADWNLRTDFNHPRSFYHDSNEAAGLVISFGTRFGAGNLLFNLDLRYQKWTAEDGYDEVYFSDGTIGVTRLNEVNWESFAASAGMTVRF